MKINYQPILPPFMNDVQDIVRAFYPYIEIDDDAPQTLSVSYSLKNCRMLVGIVFEGRTKYFSENIPSGLSEILYKKAAKKFVKTTLYLFCVKLTGKELPYGSLTGVHPLYVYRELKLNFQNPRVALERDFYVSPSRASLLREVSETQCGYFSNSDVNCDLYINVPFCPTRCSYCSFISTEVGRVKAQIPEYAAKLRKEIEETLEVIAVRGRKLRSVYVGGGTPFSLSAETLKQILEPLKGVSFTAVTRGQLKRTGEFTIEAGRPDAITREKLEAALELGVTRISVNPQTLNDATLVKIGRNHTAADFFASYALAREYPFEINVDLIAALPDETFEDFRSTVDGVIALAPDNITVHTLSIKHGSQLNLADYKKSAEGVALAQTDYAHTALNAAGYFAYYLYRQKNTADNLENVGYAKKGKECVYNIDYMEETNTVYACGAGAVTKFVFNTQNRIERVSGAKDLNTYLERPLPPKEL
ncbi:MAG: coproporphyrinogen dehydrogenase HemZ [Christensenellaceae bacterium]|jgi:oxygen-independent coproporphyrinogen-3 oxidase|nr:coproporphyrinogen dehydrogenase HemZ [Christensenellaceae bacterium]